MNDIFDGIKEIIKGKPNVREINFQPTRWCNYACSYCIQGEHTEKLLNDEYYIELAANARAELDKIQEKYPQEKEKFAILGGEVGFLNLVAICEKLYSKQLFQINITTNLSADVNNFLKVHTWCKSKKVDFFLIVSFHEEFADINEFFSKVALLRENGVNLQSEFVLHDENHSACLEYLKKVHELGITNYKINLKREMGSVYEKGEKRRPYCTQKTLEFIDSLNLDNSKNVLIIKYTDGTEKKARREYFTNSNIDGRCDFNGKAICKERNKFVRFSPKGMYFCCGGMENEILCTVKTGCSLCGNLHLEMIKK